MWTIELDDGKPPSKYAAMKEAPGYKTMEFDKRQELVLINVADVYLKCRQQLADKQAEVEERHLDLARERIAVDERHGEGAVHERTRPDALGVRVADPSRGHAEAVLADRYHLVVHEQVARERVKRGEIAADEERRADHAPERHVRVLLVGREETIRPRPPS